MVEAAFEAQHAKLETELPHAFPQARWVFQLERGAGGLLHYQGHLNLKTKLRLQQVVQKLKENFRGIHLSTDSNRGGTQAEFYAMKNDETKVAGPWHDGDFIIPDYSTILPPSGWGSTLKDVLTGPPVDRTIHWVWETTGKTGKTMFANWMELNTKTVVLGLGTAADNFYAVSALPSKKAYIFDVPRTQPKRWDWAEVYMSIEKIKDRNFLSTKYKPQKVFLPVAPHVLVFANQPPARKLLSDDRWRVWTIRNNELVASTQEEERRFFDEGRENEERPAKRQRSAITNIRQLIDDQAGVSASGSSYSTTEEWPEDEEC